MIPKEEIKRLEQTWMVLEELFKDLAQRNIKVNVASELRNCKTLIHVLQMGVFHPSTKEPALSDDSLLSLQQAQNEIRCSLVSAALNLNEDYAKDWIRKIDKAERAELNYAMTQTGSKFVPGLPKDLGKGWVRLTLPKPIAEERVQDVAEQAGVIVDFEDDLHIIISGGKSSIKRAAQNVYDLSSE